MLTIAVCDDDINELSNMVQLINLYRTEKNLNCEYFLFPNGFDLMSTIEKGKLFDVYFLDIMMPGFTGIEVAKEIRNYDKTTPIIFLTSSPEFALESYSVKAINYCLKPITREKFFYTFNELVETLAIIKDEDIIIVKSTEGIQKILVSNLIYAEIIGRNVYYHLFSGKVIECLEPFKLVCEKLLKFSCFLKPHRSYLINMQFINTIDTIQIILHNGTSIPIPQGKARDIKQLYLNYQMEGE